MVLVKNVKFLRVFILRKINQKNVYENMLEKKKGFQDFENENVKEIEKWRIFQRGLSLVLVKNLKFFYFFCFSENTPGKCFDYIKWIFL